MFIAARLVTALWLRERLIAPAHRALSLAAAGAGFVGTPPSAGATAASTSVTLEAEGAPLPNAWVFSSRIVDGAGRYPSAATLHARFARTARRSPRHPQAAALPPAPGNEEFRSCITQLSAKFHVAATYLPGSKYWPLQGAETAVFLALAVGLIGFSFWWLRRRLA